MFIHKANCLNISGRLTIGFLCLILFSLPAAADKVNDEFLTGYVSSTLERDMHWRRDSYLLKIINGVAVITLFTDDPIRREEANKKLSTIDGLHSITIAVKPLEADKLKGSFMGITGETEAFPTGDLFRPIIADPKQPQFFVSINRFKSPGTEYTMASVGFGETFGLYRFFGNREGDGFQLSVEGALLAQFNLDTPSWNLINADYIAGIPATYRYGVNSFRFRIFHQSSHLGDELLLSSDHPDRINLSYEAIEFIYSLEFSGLRLYGGGEYLLQKEPDDLKPLSAHWGLEYRFSKPFVWNGRPIFGVDMKSLEEHKWELDTSIKAGLEFGHPNPGQRRLRLMAEWYKGFDPHGQFYDNKVEYYGIGISLGF